MRVGFDHSEERSIGKLRLRNPAPKLNAIIEPMLTINFADDLINPPELLHLPTTSNYTEVMFPAGPCQLRSHDTRAPCCLGFGSWVFLQRLPHER
jgi:hypothetical protein